MVILSATAAVAAVSACSSGASSATGTASSSAGQSTALAPLTVTVASEIPEYSPVYIGEALGIFSKEGLQVSTIDNAGSNGTNYLVSGRADLEFYSPTQAILTRSKGQDIKIIYDNENFDGAALLGEKSLTSTAALQAQKGCVIGATPQGTNDYYMAKKYIQDLHLSCSIKIFATVPPMISAVSAGAIQAAAAPYSSSLSVVSANQGNLLVDPATAQFKSTYVPEQFCAFAEIGIASNLAKKKASVIAFIKGIEQATAYIESHSPAQVVSLLQKEPAFKSQPASALVASLKAAIPFMPTAPNWGMITKSQWSYALTQFSAFGLAGFDASSSAAQYSNIVDMSYVQATLS